MRLAWSRPSGIAVEDAERIGTAAPEWVTDVVSAYDTVQIEFDADRSDARTVEAWIATLLAADAADATDTNDAADAAGPDVGSPDPAVPPRAPRTVPIPVRYDGPDLADVANAAGLTVAEAIDLHAGADYRVRALGFAPGFPFLVGLPEALRTPRLARPRARVPAHSVAIANDQAGLYPLASPGGWRLLGRARVAVYDPHRPDPFLLRPGDRVRFEPADGGPPPEPDPLELLPEAPERPAFEVERAGLADLVLDAGRFRVGRFGLARSGPLDPPSFRRANRLLAQDPDAPALEMTVRGPVLRARRDLEVAFAGGGVRPWLDGTPLPTYTVVRVPRGARLSFLPAPTGARGYLAVAGGFEAHRFLGSASVDLRARVGRPLAEGDLLGVARDHRARVGFALPPPRLGPWRELRGPKPVRIVPGPHPDADAWSGLRAVTFTVAHGDRTGVRLDGPTLPGGEGRSEPTVLGGVQVPPDGRPIVLLADRGSIGGYRTPARVVQADLPVVAQARPGERLRFVAATGAER